MAPELLFELALQRRLVAVGEQGAKKVRSGSACPAVRVEATLHGERRGDTTVEEVLRDGLELLLVEHSREVDKRARRRRHRNASPNSPVAARNVTTMDDDE
ncbi:MAG: hypothetical protein ACREJT_18215 [Myxococcota bacterium]